ncbi:hypothetical protein RSOLAG22IIIB_08509 [Rhizoctonia solani]|uniref:Uncharacterized protein n=1 Tax=Rhizoctonia solani TaxID=456999 RepID=A0A0K6FTR6_9AGAM|nr:hypothetical protein RSOLAG22IIIB_08509 [Rhizoctonia solani]
MEVVPQSHTLKVMKHRINSFEPENKDSNFRIVICVLVDNMELFKKSMESSQLSTWEGLEIDVWKKAEITIQVNLTKRVKLFQTQQHKFSLKYAIKDEAEEVKVPLVPYDKNRPYNIFISRSTRQLNDEELGEFLQLTLQDIESLRLEDSVGKNEPRRARAALKVVRLFNDKTSTSVTRSFRVAGLASQTTVSNEVLRVLRTSTLLPTFPGSRAKGIRSIQLLGLDEDNLHDKVFLILNAHHGTGVHAKRNAHHDQLVAYSEMEQDLKGQKWHILKADIPGKSWYIVRPVDYPGRAVATDGSINNLIEGATLNVCLEDEDPDSMVWWTIEPVGEVEGRYMIMPRTNRDFCWSIESSVPGAPVKLREYVEGNEENHWNLRLVL